MDRSPTGESFEFYPKRVEYQDFSYEIYVNGGQIGILMLMMYVKIIPDFEVSVIPQVRYYYYINIVKIWKIILFDTTRTFLL